MVAFLTAFLLVFLLVFLPAAAFLVADFFAAVFLVAAFLVAVLRDTFLADFLAVTLRLGVVVDVFALAAGTERFLVAFLTPFLVDFFFAAFLVDFVFPVDGLVVPPPEPNAESHPLLYFSFVPTRTMAMAQPRFNLQKLSILASSIMGHRRPFAKARTKTTAPVQLSVNNIRHPKTHRRLFTLCPGRVPRWRSHSAGGGGHPSVDASRAMPAFRSILPSGG